MALSHPSPLSQGGTRETETTSLRREAIVRLRRAGVSDVQIGKSLKLSPRRVRAIAGARTAMSPPAVEAKPIEAKPDPEPAAPSTAHDKDGEYRQGKPQGQVIPKRVPAVGPDEEETHTTATRGEVTSSGSRSSARTSETNMTAMLSGVAAAYREQDLWDAKIRAVEDALERGDSGVEFVVQSTGEVEYLSADDLYRLRHHLRPPRD